MSDPQQIERDLREFFEIEGNLKKEDRLNYLRTIFDKHLTLRKLDHMVNYGDLQEIISQSKRAYGNITLPAHITGKRVDTSQLPTLAMLEAFVGYLNKNHLLKKLTKLDYTDSSGEYDEID
jgi:hypothetical protein